MSRCGKSLLELIAAVEALKQVRKIDVRSGDYVIVKTCNSVYILRMVDKNECLASGGWFDKKGVSPVKTKVKGCTWGGTTIKMDIVAACGLCIEFANNITTSEIRMIMLMPYWSMN